MKLIKELRIINRKDLELSKTFAVFSLTCLFIFCASSITVPEMWLTPFRDSEAQAQEYTAESLKARADIYFKDSDYSKAAEKYTEALGKGLASKEDQYMTHLNLGFSLIELGKSKEALPHYEAAKKIGAPFVKATPFREGAKELYDKGIDYYGSGNYKESIVNYEEALKRDPSNGVILTGLGWAHYKIGDLKNAEKCFKQAMKNDPLCTISLGPLGILYYDSKSPKGIPYYSIALLIGLEDPEIEAKFNSRIMEMRNLK